MLAETADRAFSRAGWIFEPKLDGYRVLAARARREPRLLTRNGNDYSSAFPEVARAVAALPFGRLLLDGEVVALDDTGRPSFQRLQGAVAPAASDRHPTCRRSRRRSPTTRSTSSASRTSISVRCRSPRARRCSSASCRRSGALRYLEHVEDDGEALYREAERLGLEGIVAKKATAPYKAGRSPLWLKVRSRKTADYVVVGYTSPKGSRSGFGALHLAEFVDGSSTYTGRVGTGFNDRQLADVSRTLQDHRRPTPPCEGPIPSEKATTWVEPLLVCEVEYTEWTEEGLLRQPVFLRFRDDKRPEDCVREGGQGERADGGAVRR